MSEKTITLPSGATVTLRDPAELRVKDRKKIMRIADQTDGGELSRAMALGEALIAMLVKDWSFDLIIPSVKLETLEELDVRDYDTLIEQTKDAQKALFPSLTENEETEKDPKATTANSNG